MRGFVFRYQLARLLAIQLAEAQWTPRLITELLKERSQPDTAQLIAGKHWKLAKLVSQVA